jgi:hypothetical protein
MKVVRRGVTFLVFHVVFCILLGLLFYLLATINHFYPGTIYYQGLWINFEIARDTFRSFLTNFGTVFSALGILLLTAAFFLKYDVKKKLAAGVCIILVCQALSLIFPSLINYNMNYARLWGGPIGHVSLGGMLLVMVAIAEYINKDIKKALIVFAPFLCLTVLFFVLSRNYIGDHSFIENTTVYQRMFMVIPITASFGYLVYAVAFSLLLYIISLIAVKSFPKPIKYVQAIRYNSFLIYIILYLVMPLTVSRITESIYNAGNNAATIFFSVILTVVVHAILYMLTMFLYKKKWRFKLG